MVLYKEIQKKHLLPAWEELDKYFDVEEIEEKDRMLKEIRKKVSERIHYVTTIIEHILMPDTGSYVEMYECRMLEDSDKEKLLHSFKQLMVLDRKLLISALQSTEEQDAKLVKEATISYKEHLPAIIQYIEKVQKSWSEVSNIEEVIGYLG